MSMLSAQADELRERAKVLRQGRWSDGADDARLMEDAAGTINELRGALQVASIDYRHLQSENDMLRELVRDYHSAMCCTLDMGIWPTDPKWLERRMRELGIEVDG